MSGIEKLNLLTVITDMHGKQAQKVNFHPPFQPDANIVYLQYCILTGEFTLSMIRFIIFVTDARHLINF
ncbi:MAG TPA: hypothetical protein DCY25_04095 [Bacteroidales bacterium]|nr:hypothetical protein [Bacteroidales bacterium]